RERLRLGGTLERGVLRDGHLDHGEDRLSICPVEDVVLPVLAAVAERLERRPAFGEREQHGGLRAVVIPDVVVDFLEMPAGLAGPEVERDYGGGEEIVAWTVLAQDVRSGIASRHVDEPQVRVDRGRVPDRRAASLELIALR